MRRWTMNARRLEVLHMLRGLQARIRSVRKDITHDHDPTVTGRLWNAEMQIRSAERVVETDLGRSSLSDDSGGQSAHSDPNVRADRKQTPHGDPSGT